MIVNKKCLCCGKVWRALPADAKLAEWATPAGYYFNCECKSTLIWPIAAKKKNLILRVAGAALVFTLLFLFFTCSDKGGL